MEPIGRGRDRNDPWTLSATLLDRSSSTPLHRQIYELLRRDVLDGRLRRGQRLAATRAMAEDLGVSRNTVLEAVEQLAAEGYLTARVGAGTFVAEELPEELLELEEPARPPRTGRTPRLSRRGESLRARIPTGAPSRSCPFQLGRPALDLFPWASWRRLLARRARELPRDDLDYSDVAGYLPLRELLADVLRARRGLACSPEQILVVRGSQQALDLAARVLLDDGDPVWIEDPGYPAALAAFRAAGARRIPVPVDSEGLDVAAGRDLASEARLAYVTPSHQYPLGVTMTLSRRVELLTWARETDAWIVEDDYDSEYRFEGRPLTSLAALDGGRHVIYVGTLSKVLFPGLRLGILVVPLDVRDAFLGARAASDRGPGVLEQAVLADFLAGGHFDRHVRRMRRVYAERQTVLARALGARLGAEIELRRSPAGLHDIGWLRRHEDDAEVADRAERAGVRVGALSHYCARARLPPALLFGYAGFAAGELEDGVERLASVLRS